MHRLTSDRVKLIRALETSVIGLDDNLKFIIIDKIIYPIRRNVFGHFLSLSQEEDIRVSYAVKPEDKYFTEKRIKTTLRRYIRRQLKLSANELCDADLSLLGNKVNEYLANPLDINNRIKLLKGQDIERFYNQCSYRTCMTGLDSFKTELYVNNPDKINLLVFDDNVKALLWTCDDGVRVLDRIYPSGCDSIPILRKWARKNNIVVRLVPDSRVNGTVHLSDGQQHFVTLTFNKTFPYLDTFCFGSFFSENKKVVLTNFPTPICFHRTDGTYYEGRKCTQCGEFEYKHQHMIRGIGLLCNSCYKKIRFNCKYCGEPHMNSNKVITNGGHEVCRECYTQFYICGVCQIESPVRLNMIPSYSEAVAMNLKSRAICPTCMNNLPRCLNCGSFAPKTTATTCKLCNPKQPKQKITHDESQIFADQDFTVKYLGVLTDLEDHFIEQAFPQPEEAGRREPEQEQPAANPNVRIAHEFGPPYYVSFKKKQKNR